MGFKIVYIKNDYSLRIFLNNMVISNNDWSEKIPLDYIDTLIVDSYNTTFSTNLLTELGKYNICIIFCDRKHLPSLITTPLYGNQKTLIHLQKQITWKERFKGQTWKKIVQNKISNQIHNLVKLELSNNITALWNFYEDVKDFDINNREGHVAKLYFQTLFGKNFVREKNTQVTTTLNSILNFGYAIILSMIARSIVAAGLDTRIAIFHRSGTNYLALATDLIEPFRPLIDNFAYKYRYAEVFTIKIKVELIKYLASCKIFFNHQKYFLAKVIKEYVISLRDRNEIGWVDIWE